MAVKTTIKPLFDNVLVKPLEAQTKTSGGLYLPESAKEEPQEVEVMAIGAGALDPQGKLIPMQVAVGDKVLCAKWGGNEIKVGNEKWKLVKQSDILAIVK